MKFYTFMENLKMKKYIDKVQYIKYQNYNTCHNIW